METAENVPESQEFTHLAQPFSSTWNVKHFPCLTKPNGTSVEHLNIIVPTLWLANGAAGRNIQLCNSRVLL